MVVFSTINDGFHRVAMKTCVLRTSVSAVTPWSGKAPEIGQIHRSFN